MESKIQDWVKFGAGAENRTLKLLIVGASYLKCNTKKRMS